MKKFLALILSLVCIFALAFTACGDRPGDNTEDTNKEQPDGKEETPGGKEETPGGSEEKEENQPHTHNYETTWSNDKNYHWHKASCHPDEIKDKAAHEYSGGKCIVCNMAEPSSYSVGDKLPDFTVETFNSSYTEGTFSSADARGKVIVINFWYTGCGPCVEEMPDIEEMNRELGDNVIVLALHKDDSQLAVAQNFIDIAKANDANPAKPKTPWSDYKTIFGKDLGDKLFEKCGGTTMYPLTVVLDREGIITSIIFGSVLSFDYNTGKYTNTLTPKVKSALAR